MDKNILIKLSELADELDSNHLYKEANIVTETMTRMAQEMGDEKPWWQTPPPEKPYGIDPLITENTKLRDQISALDYYVKFLLDLLKASNKRQDAERIEKMVGRFLVDESREASSSNDMTRIAQMINPQDKLKIDNMIRRIGFEDSKNKSDLYTKFIKLQQENPQLFNVPVNKKYLQSQYDIPNSS